MKNCLNQRVVEENQEEENILKRENQKEENILKEGNHLKEENILKRENNFLYLI